jgi:two-component system sensor histidine kinase DesK
MRPSLGLLSAGADEHPPSASTARGRAIRGIVFASLWLTPVIGTYRAILHHEMAHPWLAGIAVTAFVIAYLGVITLAFGREGNDPSVRDQLALAGLSILGLVLILAYPGQVMYLGFYLGAAGAAIYRPPKAFAWIGGMVALMLAIGVWQREEVGELAQTAFSMMLAAAVVMLMRQAIHLIRQLRATQQELARSAVEQERLRFARDLHDLLGHSLSLIVVKAEVARRLAERDPRAAAREAGEIETIGRQALAEVRQAVTGYRTLRFADEVLKAKAALSDAGIEPVVRITDDPLPSELDDVLGWVIREATTNVIRHSQATSCVIALVHDRQWRLEVRDDGKGGQAAPGNGLLGLRERLAAVGGTLDIVIDQGYTLRAIAT